MQKTRNKRRVESSPDYVASVNRAIDFIMGNLGRPLRLGEIAGAAGFSAFHFHRVFQALVGETPTDFAKRLRLERAVAMMAADRRMGLARIASGCGFATASDFSRSFKQKYGVTPRAFDLEAWQREHRAALEATLPEAARALHVSRPAARTNPDGFRVRVRSLPARTVAYIRVSDPYHGGVVEATERLMAWADRHGVGDNQWLGYQWENPELVPLEQCRYHVAVVVDDDFAAGDSGRFGLENEPRSRARKSGRRRASEIGRYKFPAMTVAEIEIRGSIDLELRALQYLYGVWLPRSGRMPADHPCFEAWCGRPFAHGVEYFELGAQLPVTGM